MHIIAEQPQRGKENDQLLDGVLVDAESTFKLCFARNGWRLDAVYGALLANQVSETECLKYCKYRNNCDGFHNLLPDCFC